MESDLAACSAPQPNEPTVPHSPPYPVRFSAWMFLAALFAAPLALSCRPFPLMIGLGLYLLAMTGVWAIECVVDCRKPFSPKILVFIVALLALLVVAPLCNASAIFDGLSHSFVPLNGGIRWLPTTVDRWNSLATVIQTLGALGALLVAVDLAATAPWRKRMCVAAGFAGAIVVGMGLLEKMGPLAGFAEWVQHRRWAQGVPFGTFDYHGNAGTFLNLVIPAAAALAIQTHQRWRRVGWLVLLAACYVSVVLNVSRAALVVCVMLAPLVVGTVYWGTSRHRAWAIGLSAAAVVLMGVVVLTGHSPSVQRLGDRTRTLWTPYYDRTLTYKTAWALGKAKPVFGWGPGSYRLLVQTSPIRGNYFAPAYVPGNSFSVLSDVEEDYLQTLVEWGWVGLAIWGMLPVGGMVCLGMGWRRRGARPAWPYVLIGAGIVSVYVHALIDCPLQNSALQLYVCAFLGMAWSSPWWHCTGRVGADDSTGAIGDEIRSSNA